MHRNACSTIPKPYLRDFLELNMYNFSSTKFNHSWHPSAEGRHLPFELHTPFQTIRKIQDLTNATGGTTQQLLETSVPWGCPPFPHAPRLDSTNDGVPTTQHWLKPPANVLLPQQWSSVVCQTLPVTERQILSTLRFKRSSRWVAVPQRRAHFSH